MVTLGNEKYSYETTAENWGNLPEGCRYQEATAVDVDENDNVYVFNRGTHPMLVFDPDGNVLRSWGTGVFASPHGITIGPDGMIYCTDNADHTVRKFTPEGKLLLTLGEVGKPAAEMSGIPFCRPTHTAIDSRDGGIYVADGYSNARVHKFAPDGKHLFSWGESGTDAGQFNIVHNITTDKDGWVYIADRENHRIQVFNPDGKYETQWVGSLARTCCICIDTSHELAYVGELWAGLGTNITGTNLGPRITITDLQGNVLARLGDQSFGPEPGRFFSPHGIAVDSKGDIYLAEVSYTDPDTGGSYKDPPIEQRSMQKFLKKS